MITNLEFLKTIFGDNYNRVHVTSFYDDPTNIPNEHRGRCWGGNWYQNINVLPQANQYFTISLFNPDEKGKSRRRESLFQETYVIVADDVREKLDVQKAEQLPTPTYKLETSPGSEQWGWVLDKPCADRNKVKNLLDGLIKKGLAPDGKDPGMTGVTRYVRLPEGVNTKASKLVDGAPTLCKMLDWSPGQKVSIEALASVFDIDLDAERRDTRVDGAALVDDHPITNIPEIIKVKKILSPGRYDIVCPWAGDHTNGDDSGTAIFTNDDGSIGFKCYHGSCEHRTGKDLIDKIEEYDPRFSSDLDTFKLFRAFDTAQKPNYEDLRKKYKFMGELSPEEAAKLPAWQPPQTPESLILEKLKTIVPGTTVGVEQCYEILESIDPMDVGIRNALHSKIRAHMDWGKRIFNTILTEQRKKWYQGQTDFYQNFLFVGEQNKFVNTKTRVWYTPDAFQNMFCHLDSEARSNALMKGMVRKVEKVDYAPGESEIFYEDGSMVGNLWVDDTRKGKPGDCSMWLNHFDIMGWGGEHKAHMLKWMAFTLRHPEQKINHSLLLCGPEGCGKDFLLQPLSSALGKNARTVQGHQIPSDFNHYLWCTKFLNIGELEVANHAEAKAIENKLKPICAAPPWRIDINLKNVNSFDIRNIVNAAITANGSHPIKLRNTRRYYALWTDLNIKVNGQITPEWEAYWTKMWAWMQNGGWEYCVDYLMNQVDLSDFNPGTPPRVTEFLREIQEASESPLLSAGKMMIEEKCSYFEMDLVTTKDMHKAVSNMKMFNIPFDFHPIPNPIKIAKALHQAGVVRKTNRVRVNGKEITLWCVRDFEKYEKMKGPDLYLEYMRQMERVGKPKQTNSELKIVPLTFR